LGGFITAGLTGPLVTLGFGGEVTVIVVPPVVKIPTPGGGLRIKRRVHALTVKTSHPIVILKMQKVEVDHTMQFYKMLKITEKAKLAFKHYFEFHKDNPLTFNMYIIHEKSSKIRLLHRTVTKSAKPIDLLARRIVTKAMSWITLKEMSYAKKSKDVTLIDTKELISDISKKEMIDMIDRFEKIDKTECEECGEIREDCECDD